MGGYKTMVPIIIAVALFVGLGAHFFSKTNDSVIEQIAEEVLQTEGIGIDFSASDKAQAAKEGELPKS